MEKRVLRSLAVIPDGNRRYAVKHGLPLAQAYAKGFQKVREVTDWAGDASVSAVTFWALSLDNFTKRSSVELQVLFKLMKSYARDYLGSEELLNEGVRTKFFGRLDLLPKRVRACFDALEEQTRGCDKRFLNLAIAYSGKDELVRASRELAHDFKAGKIKKIDEKAFEQRLYCPESPDLIVRTGDSPRLSGFLPWQNAYSELYFSKKLWPEFDRKEFDSALRFFENTDSRLGS